MYYKDDFPYDPKISPTVSDFKSWMVWGGYAAGGFWGSALGFRDLGDAWPLYAHYRDGTGLDVEIDYEKAYRDDRGISPGVDREIARAQKWAEFLFGRTGKQSFSMTGNAVNSGHYPVTENWQKVIGEHKIWGSASVSVKGGCSR